MNDMYNTTTLTASAYSRKVSVELPVDCNANELLDAFRAIMIGLTYSPDSFNDAILNYVDDHELLKDRTLQSDDLYNAETNINLDTIRRQETIIRRLNKILDTLRNPTPGILAALKVAYTNYHDTKDAMGIMLRAAVTQAHNEVDYNPSESEYYNKEN